MNDEHPKRLVQTSRQGPPEAEIKPVTRRMIKSSDLLGGTNELLIEHNGGIYSLRQTSNGKLILTK
jgi:hemin uptake protein HemP